MAFDHHQPLIPGRNTGAVVLLAQATSGFNDIILYNLRMPSPRSSPLSSSRPIDKDDDEEDGVTGSTTLDVNSYTLRAHIQFKFLTYGNSRTGQQSSQNRFIAAATTGAWAVIGNRVIGNIWMGLRRRMKAYLVLRGPFNCNLLFNYLCIFSYVIHHSNGTLWGETISRENDHHVGCPPSPPSVRGQHTSPRLSAA